MKHSTHIVIGAILFLVTLATHAATVSLTPLMFSGSPGSQTASTDVMADFGSTLVQEGAFGVVWPDVLGTPTFSFSDSITNNAAFADSLGGSAAFFIPGGMLMGANTRIGTFTFPLTGLLGNGEIAFDKFSQFFNEANAVIDTDLNGTLVAVPLPAAGWLLLGGLGPILFATARRKLPAEMHATAA